MDNFPRINPGERATMVGRSGSGKSTVARWLLTRSPGVWIIHNPKHTSAYDSLPNKVVMHKMDGRKLAQYMREFTYIIWNPTTAESDPEYADDFLGWLQANYMNVGFAADELYMLHTNGRAGPGLTGWLTRGRELKQSFLGLTQRPAWISKFLLSESNYIGEMSLNQQQDRKVIFDIVGHPDTLKKLDARQWFWYETEKDKLTLYGAVPMT